MLFRRKPKRVIRSWDDLTDALVAFWNADLRPDGARVEATWKEGKETLSQRVFVRAAQVPHLGLVAFLEAPLGVAATEENVARAAHMARSLLVGGVTAQAIAYAGAEGPGEPELVLRHSIPVEGVPFAAVHAIIESLASGAHTLSADLRS